MLIPFQLQAATSPKLIKSEDKENCECNNSPACESMPTLTKSLSIESVVADSEWDSPVNSPIR